jgi:hypothetical protein
MKVNIGKYPNRKVKVEIADHDLWNLDFTLAKVIHPALIKFRSQLHSCPSTLTFDEWKDYLDKMIWSFEQIVNDEPDEPDITKDNETYLAYHDRIQEGLNLFSKYFRNLWI